MFACRCIAYEMKSYLVLAVGGAESGAADGDAVAGGHRARRDATDGRHHALPEAYVKAAGVSTARLQTVKAAHVSTARLQTVRTPVSSQSAQGTVGTVQNRHTNRQLQVFNSTTSMCVSTKQESAKQIKHTFEYSACSVLKRCRQQGLQSLPYLSSAGSGNGEQWCAR